MGRKKTNNVFGYFDLSEVSEGKSKCLICEKTIKSQHGSNLLAHLKNHPSVYEIVVTKNKEDSSSLPYPKKPKHKDILADTVIKECVNLTTVHGRPFTLIDDKAFQNIIGLIPGNVVVNSKKIKECVQQTALALRKDVRDEVKNKLFSLKVDAATYGTRCFLGINIQFACEDKIVIKNLGVIELYARHTGEYFSEMVLQCLDKHRLSLSHIFSCTTDNGANMLKMTKILKENLNASLDTYDQTIDSSSDSDSDSEVEDCLDPESFQESLNNALTSSFDSIPAVRCAAHTLQLAIRDACDDNEIQDLIKIVRILVKKLRTQNYAMFLKASGKKKPLLDCATRWASALDMLERFVELKEVISGEPNNDLYFPPEKWYALEDVIKSLKPTKILTKRLQFEHLTLGDFYGNWLKCQLECDEIDTSLSKRIAQKMKERQKLLFENVLFVSAIYLDPRFNATLTESEQIAARLYLLQTYRRLISIESRSLVEDEEVIPVTSTASGSTAPVSLNNSEDTHENFVAEPDISISHDKLREFLKAKYSETHDRNASTLTTKTEIRQLKESLIFFLNEPLLDHSVNIFDYWATKKSSFPSLYKLSQIVLAAPATQVSVERLFSSVKFVVSNLRMSLKDSLVEDILFIRNNSISK